MIYAQIQFQIKVSQFSTLSPQCQLHLLFLFILFCPDLSLHGKSLQQQKLPMRRSRSLPSQAHWFDSRQLEPYLLPRTLLPRDLFGPSLSSLQEEGQDHTDGLGLKGICFGKANKPALFGKTNKNPGPCQYFQAEENKQGSNCKGRSISKTKRFSESSTKSMGLCTYQLSGDILKKSFQERGTLTKADKNNYFTHAERQMVQIPGPGTYNPSKGARDHSQLSLLPKKQSISSEKTNKENKESRRVKAPGPATYAVKTEASVGCSAVMRRPLKESDDKIRQKVTEMRRNKVETQLTGPGKYLKIEEWGKFTSKKHISYGLNLCSKPSVGGVYH